MINIVRSFNVPITGTVTVPPYAMQVKRLFFWVILDVMIEINHSILRHGTKFVVEIITTRQ